MPRRRRSARAQEGAPRQGARRRRRHGARRSQRSRASWGGAEWWPESGGECSPAGWGAAVRSPAPRLPPVGPRGRAALRPPLPPPSALLEAGAPGAHGESEEPPRGRAPQARDSLRTLLGELLGGRLRELLRRLGEERAEPLQAPSEARASPGAGRSWWGGPRPALGRGRNTTHPLGVEPAAREPNPGRRAPRPPRPRCATPGLAPERVSRGKTLLTVSCAPAEFPRPPLGGGLPLPLS